ncbi:MAG TPA: DUF5063 domain-containing protein [Candidatus Acidoferrum sp.]|jgi:hypothetical protein|nr:DUF5063 domain-containing protein [Candidatus Acidoferrum sp.]
MSEGMTPDERSATERFPLVAEEFCHLIEHYNEHNRKQLMQELTAQLARLCEVAARLPQVIPATEDIDNTPEGLAAHTEEWVRLSGSLRQIFGNLDGYWEIFDPSQREEPVSCSLAIDIAEIYLDLKEALKHLKSGAASDDVLWEWHFDFHSHWSRHAANALKVMLHVSDLA